MGSDSRITPQSFAVTRKDREALHGHKGRLLWFTGLSGSGKSTIANAVELELRRRSVSTYLLDGDNLRAGLNAGLGFTPEARSENIRRASEAAKLLVDSGLVVLAAFISPYRQDRDAIRQSMQPGDYVEIHVDCPLAVCEQRDPKGLYKLARAGSLPAFTGLSAPYEPPLQPELVLRSGEWPLAACAERVVRYLVERGDLGDKAADQRYNGNQAE